MEFFRIRIFVQVGVCGCAGVGKEKFNLMTGEGDKNQSLEGQGLLSLVLKNREGV